VRSYRWKGIPPAREAFQGRRENVSEKKKKKKKKTRELNSKNFWKRLNAKKRGKSSGRQKTAPSLEKGGRQKAPREPRKGDLALKRTQ